MRQAARASCLSLGGLHHYFPTKRELLLHGVQPEAAARLCLAFHAEHGWLKAADPARFLAAWVDFEVEPVVFIRPAIQAALELGQDAFWGAIENGLDAGLDDLAETLDLLVPTADPEGRRVLAQRLRRSLFAACVDRSLPADQLREELLAALDEYRRRPGAEGEAVPVRLATAGRVGDGEARPTAPRGGSAVPLDADAAAPSRARPSSRWPDEVPTSVASASATRV
jgi:AcrR family transcriptional regulator